MRDVLIAIAICVLSVALIVFVLVWADVMEARRKGEFPEPFDDADG